MKGQTVFLLDVGRRAFNRSAADGEEQGKAGQGKDYSDDFGNTDAYTESHVLFIADVGHAGCSDENGGHGAYHSPFYTSDAADGP